MREEKGSVGNLSVTGIPQTVPHEKETSQTITDVPERNAGKAVCPAEVVTWCTENGECCRGNESDLNSFVGFFLPAINCDPRVALSSVPWLPK